MCAARTGREVHCGILRAPGADWLPRLHAALDIAPVRAIRSVLRSRERVIAGFNLHDVAPSLVESFNGTRFQIFTLRRRMELSPSIATSFQALVDGAPGGLQQIETKCEEYHTEAIRSQTST